MKIDSTAVVATDLHVVYRRDAVVIEMFQAPIFDRKVALLGLIA